MNINPSDAPKIAVQEEPKEIALANAILIETKVKERFDYILDCYDHARREGNNTLQWLFVVVVGGLGMFGTLLKDEYYSISVGALASVVWGTFLAASLIKSLKSRQTGSRGNTAANLETCAWDPEPLLRWKEAIGMDERSTLNLEHVTALATAVEAARDRFILLPWIFLGGCVLGLIGNWMWMSL